MKYYLQLAEKAIQAGAFLEAAQYYEKLLLEQPYDPELVHNLTLLYVKLNRLGDAKVLLREALEKHPEVAHLHNQYGQISKHLGDLITAKKSYQQALQFDEASASVFNNLGLVFMQEAEYGEAEKCFKKALSLEPDYSGAMYNLALCYQSGNLMEDAAGCLISIINANPNHIQSYFLLGKILLQKEQLEKAQYYFDEANKLHPEDTHILQNIIVCLLQNNYYQAAKPYCLKILEIDPKHYVTLFNLGVIAEKEKQFEEAVQYYEQALTVHADYFDALNNLAVLCLERQQMDKAKQLFERAAKLRPDDESIAYTLQALSGDQSVAKTPHTHVSKLFDQYARHYDQHLTQALDYQVPQLLAKAATPYLNGLVKTLDLGCGTGLAGEAFQPLASELVGVDLSQKMIEQAQQKGIYKELVIADITTFLQQANQIYGLIIAADVFVYMGELDKLFEQIMLRLAEGGLLVFSVEALVNDSYKLLKSGRFAHSQNYIQRLARHNNLSILESHVATTRTQHNKPVEGRVFVVQKQC